MEIKFLKENAIATLYPSHTEGFNISFAEDLMDGVNTNSSDIQLN